MPKEIDDDESIARYILSKKHYSIEKQIVKPAAFVPPKNLEMSVYRTNECAEQKIWQIGDDYVAHVRKKKLLARADLKAIEYRNEDLKIVADTKPHPRHANVTNWPKDRHAIKMKCVELANKASLHINIKENGG